MNPERVREPQLKLFKRFHGTYTLLTEAEKQAVEDNLVEYHSTFASMKLTPKDDKAVHSRSPPRLIHPKEDLRVELPLINQNGSFRVLPFSKYASLIFTGRRPNGELFLHVNIRKIKSLIADACTNKNHPVSTLSDAAEFLAVKFLFDQLDCPQACHCLQRAD